METTLVERALKQRLVVLCLSLFFLISFYWLPHGLNIPPTYEEWLALFSAKFHGLRAALSVYGDSRPLLSIPYVIGYYISPGSFFGINLVQLVSIALSAFLLYLVVERISKDRLLAFFAALLYVVYPADVGRYTLRVLPLHFSVLFTLLSAYFAVLAAESKFKYINVFCFVVFQIFALSIYDSQVLLMAFFSAVIFWYGKSVGVNSRWIALAWLVVPVLQFFRLVFLSFWGVGYQSGILEKKDSYWSFSSVVELVGAIFRACRRLFLKGWLEFSDVWWSRLDVSRFLLVVVIFVFCISVAILFFFKSSKTEKSHRSKYIRISLIAFFLALGSYSVFAFSVWKDSSWRVFLFASIGASVSFVAIVRWAAFESRFSEYIFSGVCSVLVVVGYLSTSAQHDQYARGGFAQQQLVQDFSRVLNKDRFERFVLVSSHNGGVFEAFSGCTWVSECLSVAANYQDDSGKKKDFYACALAGNGAREVCKFGKDGLEVMMLSPWPGATKPSVFLPYSGTEIISFDGKKYAPLESSGPVFGFGNGFYDWEVDALGGHIWSKGSAEVTVLNPFGSDRTVSVALSFSALTDVVLELKGESGVVYGRVSLSKDSGIVDYRGSMVLAPGLNKIGIVSSSTPIVIPPDPRSLLFSLSKVSFAWGRGEN